VIKRAFEFLAAMEQEEHTARWRTCPYASNNFKALFGWGSGFERMDLKGFVWMRGLFGLMDGW